MRGIPLFIIACCCCIAASGQSLTRKIEKIIQGKQASIGVAIIYNDQTLTIANDEEYPLMSVFKFHIAVATLKKMERENIPLDRQICIEPNQLGKSTYSPLRERYPNQRIRISYRNLVEYMVAHSDNNACDLLIKFAGGIKDVDACIKSLGIKEQNLSQTESDMHANITNCYKNWSTPLAMTQLLKKIYTENILTEVHFTFLESAMLHCASGKDKLKAGLPNHIKIGHKTGHSDRTPDGKQIGDADAGVVYLPCNKKCYVTVLIKDSYEPDQVNAQIMADIMRVVYKTLQDTNQIL